MFVAKVLATPKDIIHVHDYQFLAPKTGPLPSLSTAGVTAGGIARAPSTGKKPTDVKGSTPSSAPAPMEAISSSAPASAKTASGGLIPVEPAPHSPFAFILLNSPAALTPTAVTPHSLFPHLWSIATVRLCADGASTRLYEHMPNDTLKKQFIPNMIIGDLDSSKTEVLDFYKSQGAEVKPWVDDDSTDLDKCLQTLISRQKEGGLYDVTNVVIFGAFGGRFDHMMSAFNSAYKAIGSFARIILVSDDNVCELLTAGKHLLRCPPVLFPTHTAPVHSGKPTNTSVGTACGLLPIGGVVQSITTEGLKWNLADQPLQFGGLISTSNLLVDKDVSIQTSHPVFWTASPTLVPAK